MSTCLENDDTKNNNKKFQEEIRKSYENVIDKFFENNITIDKINMSLNTNNELIISRVFQRSSSFNGEIMSDILKNKLDKFIEECDIEIDYHAKVFDQSKDGYYNFSVKFTLIK